MAARAVAGRSGGAGVSAIQRSKTKRMDGVAQAQEAIAKIQADQQAAFLARMALTWGSFVVLCSSCHLQKLEGAVFFLETV